MADRTLTVRIELEGADTVRDALGRFAGDTRSAVMQLASAGSTLGASLQ